MEADAQVAVAEEELSHSRRTVIRKAIYTGPALSAIAVASVPNIAHGGSDTDDRKVNQGLTFEAQIQVGK